MSGTQTAKLSFHPILRLLADFGNSRILDAALEYDFFTWIHRGLRGYEEIARAAGTAPRATRIVLDSLIALALVEKRDQKYFLTPISESFLVKDKPGYVGDFRHVALAMWDGLAQLKETLKTGRPKGRLDTAGELEVWEKLVVGILPIAKPVAAQLCRILRIGSERKGLRVLDIAGGSGIFGMTILEHDPAAQITQIDWRNVNAVAKRLSRERGFGGKMRFIDGEFRTAPAEENSYDLVLASNFCRFESPDGNRQLFHKAFRFLRPGGVFVINDFLPNEERTGPSFPLRFSVYTLTHTPAGECYTLSEYSSWLRQAGFREIEAKGDLPETLPGTTLIFARK
ncbi:MAG TPA: class I SAM-dependent methyltransferase [Candidatus Acidoferrales bacterium]|nr:class I SAM-dependent methyltransferase [Candidatus Acidoferrales bacterium]